MNNEPLTELIIQMIKKFKKQMQNMFSDIDLQDLTVSEVLYVISIGEGHEVTMKYLADEHNVAASAATRIVENLVSKGYVSRITGASDRRQVFVELTEQGQEMFQRLLERRQKQIATFISQIPDTQKEFVTQILNSFLQND